MKQNPIHPADSANSPGSLSPVQALVLVIALCVAGVSAYLGAKTLIAELPDTNCATAGDFIWSELEQSVNALAR